MKNFWMCGKRFLFPRKKFFEFCTLGIEFLFHFSSALRKVQGTEENKKVPSELECIVKIGGASQYRKWWRARGSLRPYHVENTTSRPFCQVKQRLAWLARVVDQRRLGNPGCRQHFCRIPTFGVLIYRAILKFSNPPCLSPFFHSSFFFDHCLELWIATGAGAALHAVFHHFVRWVHQFGLNTQT